MQDITKLTMEEKIARINALYHKSKAEGLNEEEKAEQLMVTLYEYYLKNRKLVL